MTQESAAPGSNEPTPPAAPAAPVATVAPPQPPPKPAGGSRVAAIIVLLLIVFSLTWYFVSDRLTPHTSQARVQAFVVPVAAEVAGQVLKVHVKNNDEVKAGQALFDIDPEPYRIALQRSRSDYETVRRSFNASGSTVEAAQAGVQAAKAQLVYAQQDAKRLEQIYAEDPGAISLRRVQNSQASPHLRREPEEGGRSRSAEGPRGRRRAQREQRPADQRALGGREGRARPQAHEGGRAVARRGHRPAHRRRPVRPARRAAMTLIAVHDLWINADMTENNLGNIKTGDPVDIVLDVMPGEILKGRVRSVGGGVGTGQPAQAGALPKVENSRDWLRQAQRFPVVVEFDPSEAKRMQAVRIGGQANVLVYTGDHPVMNWLGAMFMSLTSYLTYLY
jgi:multidrug resistance efflux pump